MALGAANLNRLGVANQTANTAPTTRSAEQALFRTVYLAEVIKSFQENNIMSALTQSRSITNGKSATFPTFWKTTAHYHAPGDADLDGTDKVRHDERIIEVDRVLMSDIKIAEIDELHNHFDVRSMYAEQQGAALAQAYDKQLISMALGATSTAYDRLPDASSDSNQPAWTGIDRDIGNIASTPAGIIQGILDGLRMLEEYDVPTAGCVFICRPQVYYLLMSQTGSPSSLANLDYGGSNAIVSGNLPTVGGIPILKSNNIGTANLEGGPGTTVNSVAIGEYDSSGDLAIEGGVPSDQVAGTRKYLYDFRKVAGVILHPTCLATVKLMDLKYESEYLIQKQATLMVAKMAVGHGVIREEAAVAVKFATAL